MQYNISPSTGKAALILTLLALVMTLGACMKTVPHPPLDVTFLPDKGDFLSKDGERISMEKITMMAEGKDYILVGESHKNVCDHKVQQRLLAALAASQSPPSIGLEMVAVDMQPILDDFAKGQVEIDALKEELQWSTKWGYPYSLFKPLFQVAQEHSLPVAGLNVPTAVTKKITKEGMESLTDEERALLPSTIVPPMEAQKPLLDMVFGRHTGKDADDETQRERFHLVQSIWDSKMAEEAVRLRRKYDWPVMVIAGSGHVENGWGIAHRIRRFDPQAEILMLMPWRGGKFDARKGDAFFYCPATYQSRMGATLTDTGFGGLLVEAVKRGSRADKAGLRPGDILLEASGVSLDSLFSLHIAGSKVYKEGAELIFTVRRGNDTYTANVGKLGQGKPGKPRSKKDKEQPDSIKE